MPAEWESGAAEGDVERSLQCLRKVYSIITVQLLLTIAVASVAVFVPPVALFFSSSIPGLFLYIFLIFVPFLRFCPLKYYFLLFIFMVALAFTTGLDCALQSMERTTADFCHRNAPTSHYNRLLAEEFFSLFLIKVELVEN